MFWSAKESNSGWFEWVWKEVERQWTGWDGRLGAPMPSESSRVGMRVNGLQGKVGLTGWILSGLSSGLGEKSEWSPSGWDEGPTSTVEINPTGLIFSRYGKAFLLERLTIAEPWSERPPHVENIEGGSRPLKHVSGSWPSFPFCRSRLGLQAPPRPRPLRLQGFSQDLNSGESFSTPRGEFRSRLSVFEQFSILSLTMPGDQWWSSTSIGFSKESRVIKEYRPISCC